MNKLLNIYNESGSALIFTITISALTTTILFLLSAVLNNQITLASALTYKLNAEVEIQNQLVTLTDTSNLEQSIPLQPTGENSLSAKIFKFQVQNTSLIKVKRENDLFQLPNWSSLKHQLPNTICPLHNSTPQNQNQSIRTCLFQDVEINHSSYFHGNLHATNLNISQLANQKIIIVSLGEIAISSLKLNNLENITLEIIAAGKISLPVISADNSKNVSLFATSIIGDILISPHDILDLHLYQTSTEYFGDTLTVGHKNF